MYCYLTHWGRVTHTCIDNPSINGSDNGLLSSRRKDIIWTNDGILLIGSLETNFSEILIEIHTFSYLKISSGNTGQHFIDRKKKGVSQNGQTPNLTGICSYCVLDRPVLEWTQILLHPLQNNQFPWILIVEYGQPACELRLSEGQIRLDLTSWQPSKSSPDLDDTNLCPYPTQPIPCLLMLWWL